MTAEEKLKAATKEAFAEAEANRNALDKVVSIVATSDGLIALTAGGLLFQRSTDSGHYNDGRGNIRKWRWTPIEGPLS